MNTLRYATRAKRMKSKPVVIMVVGQFTFRFSSILFTLNDTLFVNCCYGINVTLYEGLCSLISVCPKIATRRPNAQIAFDWTRHLHFIKSFPERDAGFVYA